MAEPVFTEEGTGFCRPCRHPVPRAAQLRSQWDPAFIRRVLAIMPDASVRGPITRAWSQSTVTMSSSALGVAPAEAVGPDQVDGGRPGAGSRSAPRTIVLVIVPLPVAPANFPVLW